MVLLRTLVSLLLATASLLPHAVRGDDRPIDEVIPERNQHDNQYTDYDEVPFDCGIDSDGMFGSAHGTVAHAAFQFRMTHSNDYTLDEIMAIVNRRLGETIIFTIFSQCGRRRRRKLFDLYDGYKIHPIELHSVSLALAGMDTAPNYEQLQTEEHCDADNINVNTDASTGSCIVLSSQFKLYIMGSGDRRKLLAATRETVVSIILSIIRDALSDISIDGVLNSEWISAIDGEPNDEDDSEDENNAEDIEDEFLNPGNNNDVIPKVNHDEGGNGNLDVLYIFGGSMLALSAVTLTAVFFRKKEKRAPRGLSDHSDSEHEYDAPIDTHILLDVGRDEDMRGTVDDSVEIKYQSSSSFRSDE